MGVTAHTDDCAGGVAFGLPDPGDGDVDDFGDCVDEDDGDGDGGDEGVPGCGGDEYDAGDSVGALDSGEGASGAGP